MTEQEANKAVSTLKTQASWLTLLEARSTGTSWFVFAYDTRQQKPIEFNQQSDVKDYLSKR